MNKNKNIKVCHLTSVHPPFDIRIFYKQCVSLVNAGYQVSLIAPINNPEIKKGVNIIPVKLPKHRLKRMLTVTTKMYRLAKRQNAAIYHFHDPELMFCAVLLRLSGRKVIFDIHENIRISLVSKDWLPKWLGKLLGAVYFVFERVALLFYHHLILAEESYMKYYPKKKSTVVLNYPLLVDIKVDSKDYSQHLQFVYSGVVHALRGVWEMLEIVKRLKNNGFNIVLDLVGEVRPQGLNSQIKDFINKNSLESNINIVGKVDFSEVSLYLAKAHIGFSLLKPIPNYKESLPTKIFEYMQHGLPVITNNFNLYREYVEDTETGICVNIDNIEEMTNKIESLLKNRGRLKTMSVNGTEVIKGKYNWKSQEMNLLNVYDLI